MPVQNGPAAQGKKTHEDRATPKAQRAKTEFRDTKPEDRHAEFSYGVSQAEKMVANMGRG